ncbi:hypothetical protein CVT26_001251 [Gymnopilus dilepis]|uniref:BRCT domain-containing protein n=1 Tax=Gymnopilus dilepis TaxID=231916 RepID=A0A409Y241_9AGAR|nr:hypothetical protein CVT26_001251 [Gymnopilus dilepis]
MDGSSAPSQSQAAKPPQIFAGLRIFVQASGIGTDRPRFIRTLKERGASTCSILNDAQVILINPESEEGQALIPPWSNLPEPKLLTLDWVQKSNSAGKALLAEDDWGGCIVKYDRSSNPDDDDDDWEEDEADQPAKSQQIIRSPLPTPRQTPSDANVAQPRVSTTGGQPSRSQAPPAKRNGTQITPSASSSTPSDSTILTPTDLPQNGQPMFPGFPAINGMQAFSPQMQMQMAAMFNPMMSMTQMDPRAMAMFQAMQDIVTRANLSSQAQPMMYNAPGQPSPVQEPVLPFPDVPSKSSEERNNKRHSSGTHPSATRRSYSEISDSHESVKDKKGKRRASSPSAKRRKISPSSNAVASASQPAPRANVPPTSLSRVFVKSGKQISFFVQIDLHNRGAVVDAIKKNGGRIEKDPENADYVVLYSGHKSQKTFNDLFESAQASGKPAVRSAFVYDCVAEGILLDCTEYEFDSSIQRKRKSSMTIKKEPLSSEEERIPSAEQKRLAKNAREAERRQRMRLEKERSTVAPSPKVSAPSKIKVEAPSTPRKSNPTPASVADAPRSNGRPSPPPPPEYARLQWANGYKFTVEEDQFIADYTQVLVERDHLVSISVIAEKIRAKMPHHSANSYRGRVTKVVGDRLDEWRKRSAIAFRKAQKTSQSTSSQPLVINTDVNYNAEVIELTSSPSPMSPRHEQSFTDTADAIASDAQSVLRHENKAYVKQDIEVVSQFFATLNDDGQEPEELVWARLANQTPCRAWHDWAAFYEAHYHEVQQRYGELTGSVPS